MKILFQSRVDLYNSRGGDTMQMEQTKAAIEYINPNIQIDIRPEVNVKDIQKYDLVHLFNLDWICETYLQAKWAKKHNKPIVLSAIHHSEKEVIRFENEFRYDLRRFYNLFMPWQSVRDVGKNVYRSLFNHKKIYPTLVQLIKGIRNEQREIIKISDIILVQTEMEAQDIRNDFGVNKFKWEKVVNGVKVDVFNDPDPNIFKKLMKKEHNLDLQNTPIILNVGRIEPRKNQLSLIKAFNELKNNNKDMHDVKLIFIGAYGKHSREYKYRFDKLVKTSKDIYYVGVHPQKIVASAMAQKGIYVHVSWFETTGLVTLEASLAGMSVVATGDRVREYLGNTAVYCDPGDIGSIENAILKVVKGGGSKASLKEKITSEYSWQNTAVQTVQIYRQLIG